MLTAWPAASQDLSDLVDAEVLPGWREDGGRHMAAVRLSLAPGWKTYWRSPGDAGIPPRFDWSGTQNVSGVAVHWPVPIVFYENGYRSVGYSGEVTIPLEFVTPDTQAPIALDARLDIGVCEEVCVPVSLHLQGLLEAASGVGAAQIRGALDSGPMSAREAGVGDVVCRTEPISDGLRLTLSIDMPRLGGDEAVVVELADPAIWVSEPTTERSAQQMTAVAELVPPEAKPFAMARQDVRITVLGDGRAVDIRGCTGG
ncbi:MAG: protein-disulfide reductase DsbD domain-containing protein [Pseudomonadota bacterium]